MLIKNGIAISMDGKGAWRDNIFVERLWRSIKHEEVYLRGYDSVSEACASIGQHAGRRANVGEAYHAHTRRQLSPKQYESVEVSTSRGMSWAMLFSEAIVLAEWEANAPLREANQHRERWWAKRAQERRAAERAARKP